MSSSEKSIGLVTGAAQGIGWGIAQALACDLDAIILVDVKEQVEERARALCEQGATAYARVCDVSDPAAVDELRDWTSSEAGDVNVLINNAALPGLRNGAKVAVSETTLDEWHACVGVNLTGPFLLCRAFAPAMVAQGWGRIVNISSAAGRTFVPLASTIYSASKAGLGALTWGLASELGPSGITVNAVAPGRIDTPTAGEVIRTDKGFDHIPRRRAGIPADIAGAVRYLISKEADFVTGTTIDVHGGQYMGS